MDQQFIKQCPYCNSTNNRMLYNPDIRRVVSKCEECGYSGTTLFKDVEKSLAKSQTVKINK